MGENMAVDAVASVVLQKLREWIKDKSFASNKIIGRRLEQMEQILKETRWLYLAGDADKEPNAEKIKSLRKEYLDEIYSIEDSIESFALRFTRQRKKLGFLMNHALLLKNFTALKILDSKLRNNKSKVTDLNIRTKSLNSRTNSLESSNIEGTSNPESMNRVKSRTNSLESSNIKIIQTPPLSFIHEETQGLSSSMNRVESRTNSLESSKIEGRLEIKQTPPLSSIHEETQCLSSSLNHVESRTNSLESSKIEGRLEIKQTPPLSSIHEETQGLSSSMNRVKLSYNDLDHHLKLCLIYMTLFPRERGIPVRRLIRLWLAEGFVKQRQKHEFQEDGAQEDFDNLVTRSLIMVTKQRSDGSARRCRLQGVLHDLLLEQALDIRLFHVHPISDGSYEMRRLVEYADAGNAPLEPCETRLVRSYISFNLQEKDTPAKHVNSLVSKMGKGLGLLRVLDLEGVYKPNLPDNLGDLFHLRYLGLRWTFLDKLPKSVGELPYLQTLDLKHTRIDKIPTTIWKLKNLQHLNLDEVHLDKDAPLYYHESLPDLLTLWGLSVSHESPIKNGLSKMKHLRELGITFQNRGQVQSTDALVHWISELKDLQSLRLRSKDDCGKPSKLSLRPFSGLTKLSHMKLLGKLEELPKFNQFPPRIKVLTLSLTFLSEDPMPILGQLPDLTVLRLLGNSFVEEEMVCPSESFMNLEVLKLWVLQGLKKWKVEDGAMKKLKEVNIRRCSNLEEFPTSLLKQETFQGLILNNMPPEFKDKIDDEYQCKVSTKDF
ncbi:putative disease resistance RPP8-like protein 2 [Salvia divinorum]|uniref:Disease resistance RPP8-like protein 2 n=1 Tax=Salvia divinorum TaxID=28513 RepID=A0ABD1GSY7_SALDI